jgi:hypothetical protein
MKLKEGKEYFFSVEKELMEGEIIDLYVLKGPDGMKYLLSSSNYRHYGIRKGTEIKCRVDRINCRGEIFLEPENPYYKEGKSYKFTVTGGDTRTDVSGAEVKVMIVKDIFKNLIPVPSDPLPETGSEVSLIVERITKGRLHLVSSTRKRETGSLRLGQKYVFTVVKVATGLDDEEYFVITDPGGGTHTISRNYYENYGIKPGGTIIGKVTKHRLNGEMIIEPDNPYYKPGQFISLRMTGYSQNTVNGLFTLDLEDKFGFRHCIQSPVLPQKELMRGRVKMIRKGRPLIILL